ncbi:MAG: hypothetical protein WDN24_10625 [Sphingomonas sp.]
MLNGILATLRGHARSILGRDTCPYCFERFRLAETPFRCGSLAARCHWRADETLKSAWKDTRAMGRVIPAAKRFRTQAACPDCKRTSRNRLCPHCHQSLPPGFAEIRNYVFSVVGARYSGKSHFFPAAIETFKHERGPRLGLNIMPDMNTRERYDRYYYEPLYRQGRGLEATLSAEASVDSALPLVFLGKISRKDLFGRQRIWAAFTISFFDTPGEDLRSTMLISNLSRYVYNSDGIIVLVDPTAFPHVQNRLSLPAPPSGTDEHPVAVLSNIIRTIRDSTGLSETSKIQIPIAVTLSKLDAVESLIDRGDALLRPTPNIASFSRENCDAVNWSVRTLLASWLDQNFTHTVESEFEHIRYFGVSALGVTPDAGGRIGKVTPHRVTTPFEWLLFQKGMIKAEKQR